MFALSARRDLLDNLRHLIHFSSRALLVTGPTPASCEHLLRALLVAEGAGLQRIDIDARTLPAGGSGTDSVLAALHEKLSSLGRADTPGAQGDVRRSIQGLLRQLAMDAQLSGKRLLLTFTAVDRGGIDLCLWLLDLLYPDPELAAAFCILFTAQTDFARELAGPDGASKRFLQLPVKRLSFSEFSQYAELQLGRLAPSSRELQRHYQKLRGIPEAVDAFLLGKSQERLPPSEKPSSEPAPRQDGQSVARPDSGPDKKSDSGKPSNSWFVAFRRQRLLLLSLLIAGGGTAVLATVYLTDKPVGDLPSAQEDDEIAESESESVEPESVPNETTAVAGEPLIQAEPAELAVHPVDLMAPAGDKQKAEELPSASSTKAENPSELVDRMREQFLRQRAAGGFESDTDSVETQTTPQVNDPPRLVEAAPEPLIGASSDSSDGAIDAPEAQSAAQVAPAPLPSDVINDTEPVLQTSSGEAGPVSAAAAEPIVPSSSVGTDQSQMTAPDDNTATNASVNTSERFRTASWVAARRSGDWTIQMLGSYSESLVERFLNDNPELGDAVYIQTTYKNKPWFIVLNGSYESKSAAQAALRRLPARLKPDGFWIRPFNGLK